MSVYLKAALIVASLVAALTVSAQPILTASAVNCTANTHSCCMVKKTAAKHTLPPALTAEQRMACFDSFAAQQQAQALQITAAQRALWDAYVQTRKNGFANKGPSAGFQQSMDNIAADKRAEWRARYLEATAQHARQIANSTKVLRDVSRPSNATASIR